jgi:alpha,alpha-trehalase
MKRSLIILILVLCRATVPGQQSPDKLYGPLFEDVQLKSLFPDQKTFVDSVPIRRPSDILEDYARLSSRPDFDLKDFVKSNFILPPDPDDITTHIKRLWGALRREPSKPPEGASLLALAYPYIVPGGRFDEVYY